jgi:uncharacterized protein YndB with AHSA1/START domain
MTIDQAFAVELEQRVTGSPEVVFEYFTDPEKYRRWKGLDAELDPRPGGAYRVTMGADIWVRGEYVAVEPPHRLLMTWGFESDIEIPRGLTQVPPGSSTVEFKFVPDGDGTIIRVRHTGMPSEDARFAHTLGWETYLDRLATVLAGGDPGEEPTLEMGAKLFERDEKQPAT